MYKYVFYKNDIQYLTIDNSQDDYLFEQEIITECSEEDLKFGMIASSSLNITLDNVDKSLNSNRFKNTKIEFYKDNVLQKSFYTNKITKDNTFIYIEAYDKTLNLDKNFKGIAAPVSISQLIKFICSECNIPLATSNFINGNIKVSDTSYLTKYSYREVLSFCLEVVGAFAILNNNEQLEIKWFDFANKKHISDDYITSYPTYGEETQSIDSIVFKRVDTIYEYCPDDRVTRDNVVYLTSNNPLLLTLNDDTINKILKQLYINKLSNMNYLPCDVSFIDNVVEIGEVFTFYDEDNVLQNAIVSKITFTNNEEYAIGSCDVASETEVTNSSDTKNSSKSINENETYFYHKLTTDRLTTLDFIECGENTNIYASVSINFSGQGDFNCLVGSTNYSDSYSNNDTRTVTYTCMINEVDTDKLEFVVSCDENNQFTINKVNISILFKNAIIEQDENVIVINETTTTLPANCYAYPCMPFIFDVGIQGWYQDKKEITYNNVPGTWSALRFLGFKKNSDGTYYDSDDCYFPELHIEKNKSKYKELVRNKHVIKVTFSGSYVDWWGNTVTFNNYSPDGTLGKICYTKSSDKTKSYWICKNGLIEVEDGETITFCMVYQSTKEPSINKDSIKVTFTLLDDFEDVEMAYVGIPINRVSYVTTMNDKDGSTIKVAQPKANAGDSKYINKVWVGNWKNNEVNAFAFGQDIELNCFDTTAKRYFFIYRNYKEEGYESFVPKE